MPSCFDVPKGPVQTKKEGFAVRQLTGTITGTVLDPSNGTYSRQTLDNRVLQVSANVVF